MALIPNLGWLADIIIIVADDMAPSRRQAIRNHLGNRNMTMI